MADSLQFVSSCNRPVYDYTRLALINKELNAMLAREMKAPLEHQSQGLEDLLCEVTQLIEDWMDNEPGDDELCGEPPLTADEMHSAAWREHVELHR